MTATENVTVTEVTPDPRLTSLLRFATAGSVDDGKSTLVGRLLHDTKSILADAYEAQGDADTAALRRAQAAAVGQSFGCDPMVAPEGF